VSWDFEVKHGPIPVQLLHRRGRVSSESVSNTFSQIEHWTDIAELSGPENAAELIRKTGLLKVLKGQGRLITAASSCDKNHNLISFGVHGLGDLKKTQTLHTLPVYFATMRALEIIPGVAPRLIDETGSKDKLSGRNRASSEKIYRLNITLKSNVGLGRLLFHAPIDAELHELRGCDFHDFLPSTHVLTKRRPVIPPPSQDQMIAQIEEKLHLSKEDLPYSIESMIPLLKRLLTLCDRWHWNELMGRREDDERLGN
jgi:hypothetical protein